MARKTCDTWRKRFNQDYCWKNLKTNKWKIVDSRHFVSTIAWVSQNQDREFNVFYPVINLWSKTKWKDDFCLCLSYFYFLVLHENIVPPVQHDFPHAFVPPHINHVFPFWRNINFSRSHCWSKMLKCTELFWVKIQKAPTEGGGHHRKTTVKEGE